MAIYDREQDYQSILNAALGEYQAKRFRLIEPDDHRLVLYHADTCVATFNQHRAHIDVIRETCRKHLEKLGCRL